MLQTLIAARASTVTWNPSSPARARGWPCLPHGTGQAYEKFQAMGGYLPTEGNDAPYEYVSADVNMTDALDYARWIVDMLHIQTGIPPSVWGLSGVGTSGTALDRLMFAAMAVCGRTAVTWKRYLLRYSTRLVRRRGVRMFSGLPTRFPTLAERAGAVRDDYTAKISTRREARVGRGYPEEIPDEEGENDAIEETEGEETEVDDLL